jgi:hypothetical protein
MTDDSIRTNHVSPQGSILWAKDDALARAMGKTEYSGHVRGTSRLRPLPVRLTSQSSASSASCLNHEATFNAQRNEMMAK